MPARLDRIEVAQEQLRRQLVGPAGLVTRYVMRQTRAIRNRAVLLCPVDTGNLRASIVRGTISGGVIVPGDKPDVHGLVVTGVVGTPVEYAVYVHEGTAPHVIRPKTQRRTITNAAGRKVGQGGVLAWGGKPPTRFATSVRHPGTRPRPFLRRAMEEVMANPA